jgi:hypothetical protein
MAQLSRNQAEEQGREGKKEGGVEFNRTQEKILSKLFLQRNFYYYSFQLLSIGKHKLWNSIQAKRRLLLEEQSFMEGHWKQVHIEAEKMGAFVQLTRIVSYIL